MARGFPFAWVRMVAWSAALVLGSSTAGAQSDTEKALSAALFQEGRELLEAGDVDAACPKFAESFRLVQAGGTALNLADCYAKLGRSASAWSAFREALAIAKRDGRDDRIELANKRIAELEPQLSYITIDVEQPPEGVRIELDGVEIPQAGWGTDTPVDPGSHRIAATAEGYRPYEVTVELDTAGTREAVLIPPLIQSDEVAAPLPLSPVPNPTANPTEPDAASSSSGTQQTLGWVAVGVGGAGIAAGAIFGALTLAKKSESDDICGGPECDPGQAEAVALNDDAQTFATISNIGFIAGAALAATGVVLVLTAPDDTPTAAWLEIQPGSALLRGRF